MPFVWPIINLEKLSIVIYRFVKWSSFRESYVWCYMAALLAGNKIKMYRRNLVRAICIRRDAYATFRLRVQAHPSAA